MTDLAKGTIHGALHNIPRLRTYGSNPPSRPESFYFRLGGRQIVRAVKRRDGSVSRSWISLPKKSYNSDRKDQLQLAQLFDQAYLRCETTLSDPRTGRIVRLADLFSSCGFMTLGVQEACRALGLRLAPVMAIEIAPFAANLYGENFGIDAVRNCSIVDVLDRPFGEPASAAERRLIRNARDLDMVVAGPPCQGHSTLNNVTRHSDPKNALYERIGRFAELTRPTHMIIENVPEILHDKENIVDKTCHELFSLGYFVDQAIVEMARIGVPQRRRRHILVASLRRNSSLN